MNIINTVPRNPTVRFSRIADDEGYSYAYAGDQKTHQNQGWRIFSTRRSNQTLMSSWSYRRDRARKRQIFLQTYKLGPSISSREKLMRSRKLKKMVVTVKSAVVSALAFMRGGAVRSCGSRPTISAPSPARPSS